MLSHDVYFTLNDASPAAADRLVQSCRKYLKDHPGVLFFAAGTLAQELNRAVNDRGFHVALHVVFQDKASHDLYQQAAAHVKFVEENKSNWVRVRVFDSYVSE